MPIETIIKAINVPAEINPASSVKLNTDPIKIAINDSTNKALLGNPLSLTFPRKLGNKPSRPNAYNKRDPANIIPIIAVNIPTKATTDNKLEVNSCPEFNKAQAAGAALFSYFE